MRQKGHFTKNRHGRRFKLPSYTYLTVAALFMTIGLSLLSYIGSTALVGYDADSAHWSQVQMLVRYLDEGGKANFTADQTDKGRRVVMTFENANASTQANSGTPASARNPQETSFDVPAARVSRIRTLLADNDLGDKPVVDFAYACKPIFKIFAKAQGEKRPKPDVPVLPGGPTQNECEKSIMNSVKPHVLTVADDLTLTYLSMTSERDTLQIILETVFFPVRMIVQPCAWIYHILVGDADASGGAQRPTATTGDLTTAATAIEDFKPAATTTEDPKPAAATADEFKPADAFNLLVWLQQRHAPIPTILPIPSVQTFGEVFDARLAVAITNTYLLTLSFGFLGACVWVLREINSRLETFTLAPSRFAKYRARILLGMVAGPTVGLFFDKGGHLLSFTSTSADVPSFSNQLSAAAIAFVAGFSIEILFAILDRFIRIMQEFAGVDTPHSTTR
jgi:hypothetical protein